MVFDRGRELHWCSAVVGKIEKFMEEGAEGSEDGSLRHKTVNHQHHPSLATDSDETYVVLDLLPSQSAIPTPGSILPGT